MENKEKTLAQLDAALSKVKQYENKIQLLEIQSDCFNSQFCQSHKLIMYHLV